jgi:hypothetical protein
MSFKICVSLPVHSLNGVSGRTKFFNFDELKIIIFLVSEVAILLLYLRNFA